MILFFFFFQAEDGIRDYKVTGVQTCALPICVPPFAAEGGVNGLAQLMDVELARIDDRIGQRADRTEQLALLTHVVGDALSGAQGMRTPRLAETPDQARVVGFQEN